MDAEGPLRDTDGVDRPSMFAFAGGEPAFRALAEAHHRRCLDDPVLSHPFSHPGNPDHIQRLADYWVEVFGGPARYAPFGGHSAMLGIHCNQGADDDLGVRFVRAFVLAADDAGLPEDAAFRASLRAYMEWAIVDVLSYSPKDAEVAPRLPTPHWGWNGPE